ncbi:MAG: hypothetical protein D6820_09845, partial [Lentisphaerae bacterium]
MRTNEGWPPYLKGALYILLLISIPILLFVLGQRNNYETRVLSIEDLLQLVKKQRVSKAVLIYETLNSPMSAEIRGIYSDEKANKPYNFIARGILMEKDLQVLRESIPEFRLEKKNDYFTSFFFFFGPVLLLFVLIWFLFSRQMRNAGRSAMQFGKSRARLVQPFEKVTFEDVAGIDHAREEVQELVHYLKDPDKFHRLGARIPHGVLLIGPPGTGKTL